MLGKSCRDGFKDCQGIGGAVGFSLLKVLLRLAHAIGDVGKAKNVFILGARERVKRGGFHFDGQHAFRASRFYRLRGFPEQTIEAVQAGGLKLAQLVEVPPYHYGAVFERAR